MNEFEKFRRMVLRDPTIQVRLRDISDRSEFISLTVELGGEYGCSFTTADVEEGLRAGRRSWLERWI
jgi:hypothetical protein